MSVFLLKLFFLALSSPLENAPFPEEKPNKPSEFLPDWEAQVWREALSELNVEEIASWKDFRMERGGMFRDSIRIYSMDMPTSSLAQAVQVYEGDLLEYVQNLETWEALKP